MQIQNDVKLDFKDVLILPKNSTLASRKDVDIERQFQYITTQGDYNYIDCVPIIASNMDGVGTFGVGYKLAQSKCLTAIVKHYKFADWYKFYTELDIENKEERWQKEIAPYLILSIGMPTYSKWNEGVERAFRIMEDFALNKICIDVANGYNVEFESFISRVREAMPPETFIIAGNVVTASQTERLILAGANAVKVGIGAGSVCTTRKVTGVGYPQLSAIAECADAAHGMNGFIVADGGCQVPGDVCKALAAGADFVMLGGMLAGHEEGYNEKEIINDLDTGKKYVEFYGSSSRTAQEQHNGGLAEYRSSEGKSVRITLRGSISGTLNHILGGIRSCCTYVGARKLKELSKRATFIRVQNAQQYNTLFGDNEEIS